MSPASMAQTTPPEWSYWGIAFEGWITIAAVILGPILALLIQRVLDHLRDDHKRKLFLFRALMASRGTPVASIYVEGLNQIDVEFTRKRQSHVRVRVAWKALFDHLTDKSFGDDVAGWGRKADDLRVELLYEMGRAVGYKNLDKVDIRRKIYSPGAHAELEDDQRVIRKGVVELLTGKRALSTISWLMPGQAPLRVAHVEPPAVEPTAIAHPQPQQALEDTKKPSD